MSKFASRLILGLISSKRIKCTIGYALTLKHETVVVYPIGNTKENALLYGSQYGTTYLDNHDKSFSKIILRVYWEGQGGIQECSSVLLSKVFEHFNIHLESKDVLIDKDKVESLNFSYSQSNR